MERWKGKSLDPDTGWRDRLVIPPNQYARRQPTTSPGLHEHSKHAEGRTSTTLARIRSTLTGFALLSLLPVPAGARPVEGESQTSSDRSSSHHRFVGQSKRDRRRSTDHEIRDAGNADLAEDIRASSQSRGKVDRRQVSEKQLPSPHTASPRWTTSTRTTSNHPTASSSSQLHSYSMPSPTAMNDRKRDGIPTASATSTPTPTTDALFHRMTVANTVLPYLLTTGSDGTLGTAGWELYGRVGVDPSALGEDSTTIIVTSSLMDPSVPETETTASSASSSAIPAVTQVAAAAGEDVDTTFLITDALPRGWGLESDRGDLYAVPLITVASVCLAAVIFSFIVITVVSRAKAKRRRARREKRKSQLVKAERMRSMSGDEADPAGRQPEMTGSFRDEGDGSSLGDEENGIGDIIRSERAAGQADQQRSNNGRFSAAESDGERDDVLEQKFKATGQGNRARVRRVVSVGVTRLGTVRVLEWRKGLRKRKTTDATARSVQVSAGDIPLESILNSRHPGSTQPLARTRSSGSMLEGSGEGSSTTAVDVEARGRGQGTSPERRTGLEAVEDEITPILPQGIPLPLTRTLSTALTRSTESGDQRPQSATQPTGMPPAPLAQAGSSVTFSTPHFPPAYYRAASAHGSAASARDPDLSENFPPLHHETGGTTSVQGGPVDGNTSARAQEKRPANYYPAPTTAEQEDAVAIVYGHNGISQGSSGSGVADGSLPPEIGDRSHINGESVVTGHLATDDKGVLEQLRNAASMPEALMSSNEPDSSPPDAGYRPSDATAPVVETDADGFEALAEDGHTGNEDTGVGTSSTPAFPTPPRPIVQSSLALTQDLPSTPFDMQNPVHSAVASAPSTDLTDQMAPSAPPGVDVEEAIEANIIPSAPALDDPMELNATAVTATADAPAITVAQPTNAARASHARRSLGLDLPTEETPTSTQASEPVPTAAVPRFLPKYEP